MRLRLPRTEDLRHRFRASAESTVRCSSVDCAVAGLGPFDSVLDVGGNVGEFASRCYELWPRAMISSFEPISHLARLQRERAHGRWLVEEVAISSREGQATIHVCVNQHTASTMQMPGTVRSKRLGIADTFVDEIVPMRRLDQYRERTRGRLLVKIDVEGHEAAVLAGAPKTLGGADAVIVECQQDPDVFQGSPSPGTVDELLRMHGLSFAGVLDSFSDPEGRLIQFDGLWTREGFRGSTREVDA